MKGKTIVESQTPSGPKPPLPQPPPSKSDTVWISPRLREKLGEPDDDQGPKQGSSPLVGIILAVLVIGGGLGLFVTMRSGAAKEKVAAEEKARLAAAAATAESLASVAHADSMRLAMADSTGAGAGAVAPGGAKPAGATASAPKPTAAARPTPSSAGTPAAAPATPRVVEKGPFGLDVGTFIVEERASSEQARLAAATGLSGRVVTRNEDGGDVYHVVLGSFATRAAAEKRAETLVAKGQVNQARAVPLTP